MIRFDLESIYFLKRGCISQCVILLIRNTISDNRYKFNYSKKDVKRDNTIRKYYSHTDTFYAPLYSHYVFWLCLFPRLTRITLVTRFFLFLILSDAQSCSGCNANVTTYVDDSTTAQGNMIQSYLLLLLLLRLEAITTVLAKKTKLQPKRHFTAAS